MEKIEHIGIAVKDLEKSNQLFASLFGKAHYKTEEVASEGVKTSFFQSGPNKIELLENGFILMKEDTGLHSPVGVLFYEFYESIDKLSPILQENKDSLQCVVSNLVFENRADFGEAQSPELWNYADGVDTINFLLEKN